MTFEEWWAEYDVKGKLNAHHARAAYAAGVASVEIAIPIQATEAAFAAGVASQQAEIERLNEDHAERLQLLRERNVLTAYLREQVRAYEAVVEAARPFITVALSDYRFTAATEALRAALAALDEQ